MSKKPRTVKAVPIREFLKFETTDLIHNLNSTLYVLFEDNKVVRLTSAEIVMTRYCLEIISVTPDLPILSKYAINNYYTNGIYTSKTLNKAFESILEDIVNLYIVPVNNRELLKTVYAKMQETFNNIYNELVHAKTEYATSINIIDFLEIQFDEGLINSLQQVAENPTVEAVDNTYQVLNDIMYNKPELRLNIIALGYVAGTINPNQIKQMLAARGYVTEIDSNIFEYPIASSFVLGMSNLYDLTIESRAGAKALYLSNRAVQESEYFARELQLVTMSVENLVDGDCGNRDYMKWFVRPASMAGKSDISNMIGKRFFNEETGKEEIITKQHTHLEGQNILLRTSFKCKLEDKKSICTHCFGELSYGIHAHSNLGHISSTAVTEKVTQSILSTKHLTSSATSNDINLDKTAAEFFNVKGKNSYAFKANLINKVRTSYKMIINQQDAFGIKDMQKGVDVYKFNPFRISRIESIIIMTENNDGKQDWYPIVIKDTNKYGSFTYDFLEYIVEEGYSLDDQDRYIIDLNNWVTTKPVIVMPLLEYNFLALAKNIKAVFKYMDIRKGDKSSETQESMLQKLFDLVNTKLDINIALLEVIVYAFTIMSIRNNNYDIGRNAEDPQMMRIKGIMTNRSCGGSYAWEEVLSTILSPSSFNGRNAVDHPLDVLIDPENTIKDYYGTTVL